MQLSLQRLGAWVLATFFVLTSVAGQALADGSVTLRGAYYKERSTRVVQPMLDAALDLGDDGELSLHTLVDSITSASSASGAAGSPFTEVRSEAGANYMHAFGEIRIGGGGRFSSEPDYKSRYVNMRLESSFAEKNSILSLQVARGFDSVNNSGSQGGLSTPIAGELSTTLFSSSFTQLLSPVSVLGLSYDLMHLEGFQENAYRTVIAGGMIQPERVPDLRIRHALAVNLRYFVQPAGAAVIAAYRYYRDDWGIVGHAPEVRIVKDLWQGLGDLRFSYRFYTQNRADFHRDRYDSNERLFLTDDDKLSSFQSHGFGLKLGIPLERAGFSGRLADVRFDTLARYRTQQTRYGNALTLQMALTFPVDY